MDILVALWVVSSIVVFLGGAYYLVKYEESVDEHDTAVLLVSSAAPFIFPLILLLYLVSCLLMDLVHCLKEKINHE